ncbi:MAG: glycosyltransferase [Verrucomicrobia bacterium]|nr:glycosyltransferase [Verrucomicrobiota bacterium]
MRCPAAIFYAVSDTVRNPGRSGIQSVVRSLAAALGARALAVDRSLPPIHPVVWNARGGYFQPLPPRLSLGLGAEPLRESPDLSWRDLLTQPVTWPACAVARLRGGRAHDLPLHWHPRLRRELSGGWLLLPELAYSGRAHLFLDYAQHHGLRFAAIFHDAIPLTHPEFCPSELPGLHAAYMRVLSRADLILPNSADSAAGWHRFVADEKLPTPAVRVCTLASEIPGAERVRDPDDKPISVSNPTTQLPTIRLLTVSTLEPRKNHATLLDAFSLAAADAARASLRLELHLVGAPYVGARHIMTRVHRAMREHPGAVFWHEKVEHSRLRQLYRECDFTVYPSVVEGFGLPVIESLWFGRPCVCANFGVMAENAASGGCLPADVRDSHALADAILALARSPELRAKLTAQAVSRPLKTWDEYAREIVREIEHCPARPR